MVSITIDGEAEKYLAEILVQEETTDTELIQRLLQQHWQTIQPRKTFLERRGGHPRHLLQGPGNLSDRDVRKRLIAEHVQQRHEQRQAQNP
jgi:hypothetical protein